MESELHPNPETETSSEVTMEERKTVEHTETTDPQEQPKQKTFPALRVALAVIAGFVLLLAAFQLGIAVGFRKAAFTLQWNQNYQQNITGGMPRFTASPTQPQGFVDAHAAYGTVLLNDGNRMIIRDQANVEKAVRWTGGTSIRRFQDAYPAQSIGVNDSVIIIGEPTHDGFIDAKFIRVLPPPPTSTPFFNR